MHDPGLTRTNLYSLYGATLDAVRGYAAAEGFVEIVPSFEGVPGGSRHECEIEVTSRSRGRWTLPASYTLNKQIAVSYLPRVYCVGPCYRQESNTSTHLDAFYQLEFEVADLSLRDTLQIAHRLIDHVIAATSPLTRQELLNLSWRTIDLQKTQPAVHSWSAYEKYVSSVLPKTGSQFVAIIHPPASLQPSNRRLCRYWAEGFELLMPFGLGELASGGVRDRRYTAKRVGRWSPTVEVSLPTASAGFGLGLERFIALLSGNPDLRQAVLPHTRGSLCGEIGERL
jgi:asparaginyl-tRNA synthetase